ncbi:hypothetical protein DV532_26385 (plasmid) [Pseudomonas sp. Leaf58]|nr:hypothetical protein DV532_26385 [Pseudomonas sp. Leaf58]KQN62618.1 hypothetical protein ASF02_10755 [Pseudomonas sp. Leaf58]
MIKFSDLPPDMQTLISDFIGAPIGDAAIPEHLPVIDVRLADIPIVPLCEYDRGTLYARRMSPEQTPPIIVADNQFLDGKHRRFSFLELGLTSVPAIDLTGIADPEMVKFCSMGELGAGISYAPEHDRPDAPDFMVWDYANSGFVTKDYGYSAHPNDACELSLNEIAERYISPKEYLIFPYLYFVDIQTKLRIERGTPELLARGIEGWAWQIDSPKSLGGDWYDCETAEDAVEAARLYVADRLIGVRVPEPELLLALDAPCITDALEAVPPQAVKRQAFESVLGF